MNRTLWLLLALACLLIVAPAFAQEVPQGKTISVANVFVCRTLADARAIADALATNDDAKFASVAVPLQEEGRCGMSRGVVIYQATVYERKDAEFRVLSFKPVGSNVIFYEVTNWRMSRNYI